MLFLVFCKGSISKHTLQIALNTPKNPSLTNFLCFALNKQVFVGSLLILFFIIFAKEGFQNIPLRYLVNPSEYFP